MKRQSTTTAAAAAAAAEPALPTTTGLVVLGQLLRQCQQDRNTGWETVAVLSEVCKPLHRQARTRVLKLLNMRDPLPPGPIALLRRDQKSALRCIRPKEGNDLPLRKWDGLTTVGPGAVSVEAEGRWLMTDSDVTAIATTPALEELRLGSSAGEKVTDYGLSALSVCTGLKRLDLTHSLKITDAGLSGLSYCSALQCLNLTFCGITGECFYDLAHSTALTTVTLSACGKLIEDMTMEALGMCASLQSVDFSYCAITGGNFEDLASCTELHTVCLGECRNLTDDAMEGLALCTALTHVDLHNCKVVADGIAALGACTDLEFLDLRDTKVGDAGLEGIGRCIHLKSLHLGTDWGDSLVSDDGVKIIRSCTALTKLSLRGCVNVTTTGGLNALAQCLTALTDLDLSRTKVGTIEELATNCMDLTKLNLSSLNVKDSDLQALAGGCTNLQVLDLTSCEQISDGGILELRRLPGLKLLKIQDCGGWNDDLSAMKQKVTPGMQACFHGTVVEGAPAYPERPEVYGGDY